MSMYLLAALLLGPVTVTDYQEVITLDGPNATVVATVVPETLDTVIRLPARRGVTLSALTASGPAGPVQARQTEIGGEPIIELGAQGPGPFTVRYTAQGFFGDAQKKGAHGATHSTYRFVNTTRTRFMRYGFKIYLNDGQRIHRVSKTVPAVSVKAANRPFTVFDHGEDSGLTMGCTDLRIGDVCGATYEAVSRARSPLPLIAGLVFGLLYLVFFRHVLKEERA